MTKKINLIYQLQGPGVEKGVDVFKLSPLLFSIGDLLQTSQQIAHPNGHELGINIKPFKKGSFIIELSLFAQTNLQQLIDLVNTDSIKEIKETLEWLGIISATGMYSVIKIYKFLKGQPKKFEEVGPDEVRVVAKDGNAISVNKTVFSLFQNNKIQQNLYNIYGNFLGQEGVEAVQSHLTGGEKEAVKITKADVPHFNPANAIPMEGKENENRNITRVFLKPKRVSLEGEPDNWSLRKGVDVILTATIRDTDFLNKVKSGEIRLANEDLLEVDLLEIQTLKDNEVGVKYEVVRVVNYQKSPIQTTFLT